MRKETRFLSSLVDLKLKSESSYFLPAEEEGRRKAMRNNNIMFNDDEATIYQNFKIVQKKKSSIDRNLILKSLSSHFTFSAFINDKEMQNLLLQKFMLCRVNKGEYLMKQNDQASSFFILHEGELTVQINGIPKRKIESGQGFGELALLYSAPRSASIKANKSSFLWFIDRSTFRKAIESLIRQNYQSTKNQIQSNQFFKQLTSNQKQLISTIGIVQKFLKGHKVVKKGQMASSMYIIKSGQLSRQENMKNNLVVKTTLGQGEIFGEQTLMHRDYQWEDTIIADKNTQVIALGAKHIQQALGKRFPLVILRNKIRQILVNNKDFRKLTSYYKDLTLDCFKIQNCTSNQKVDTTMGIFIVLQGKYKLINKNTGSSSIVDCKSEENKVLYGFIEPEQGNNQHYEIMFSENGKIAITSAQEILKSFASTYKQAIQKSLSIQKTTEKHQNQIASLKQQCSKYSLKDYHYVNKLGQGQFGTVFLVTDPHKHKLFALKCISKPAVINNKLQKYVKNQKIILQELSETSPFCVNYIRSYKDTNYIYFLMEFIQGLQLFDVIRLIGILNVEQTRFYGSIMVHMLQIMHNKGIIYRDLKPENIMVGKDGYPKLIDMGTCKKIGGSNRNALRTFTAIGTPNYMGPQIISGAGYSYSADLWSLGVVLYQFMAGYVPFGEQLQDPHQIYQQILTKPLQFPKYMNDSATNQFITQLLNKNPDARLNGSYSNLKNHRFLKGIQWDALLSKKAKPAFIIPKNKLPQVDKMLSKTKDISTKLPVPQKINPKRSFNPNWDEQF